VHSDEDEESCVPQAALCVLSQLVARASVLFPTLRSLTAHAQALALVERAYTRYHFEANIATAITAVGAFSFDKAALHRDLRDFEECGGDLVALAALRIAARRPQRLNKKYVEANISSDNPERELLLRFAEHGVDVRPLLPPGFAPNGPLQASWPSPSGTYARAPRVVNALLSKAFHVPGLAVILPTSKIKDWGGV
jgi:hypothetical protein